MHERTPLTKEQLVYLQCVAEGQSALVPSSDADILIQAGLVIRQKVPGNGADELQLSPAGLRRIRSSDQ